MRPVLLLMHVSLDGFTAGPKGELGWVCMDEAIFEDAIALTGTADAALYGRVTYQLMEGYWPGVRTNPESTDKERRHAEWVENIPKIVFSRTLESVTWNNTRLIRENVADEVMQLRQQPGGTLMIFGSPGLAHSLMQLDLIDEYRLNINPVLLGAGIPLFRSIDHRRNLALVHTQRFASGVVGVHYRRA